MNKKLYDLMNWPEIEGVVYSECDAPKNLLGGHVVNGGFLVQVYRPDAVEVVLNAENGKAYNMEKVDEGGFYAVLLPGKKSQKYTLSVENVKGHKETYIDPYSLENVHKASFYKSFLCGTEQEAWKILGSHACNVDGNDGTIFSVWAPNAARVSVVGTFNNWDGRLHMMEKIPETGIFELFIPGIKAGSDYNYEVKYKSGKTVTKIDPYAVSLSSDYTSIIGENSEFAWTDSAWMETRKKQQKEKRPLSIYEVNLEAWANGMNMKGANYISLAESICEYVKETGYTHIELMPVAEYKNADMNGYGTVGYFAPTARFGTEVDFKTFIDIFHKAGIGVIMDWNAAYFPDDSLGLSDFDGTDLYGNLKPSLEKNPKWNVTTFSYEKSEVRSFLKSSLTMWIKEYHVDGVRIDDVASMLYLDYGKQPGQWIPNIYGGPENLEAEKFIKELSAQIEKNASDVMFIAQESSGWSGTTKQSEETTLGFDYKWDYNWKNEFLSFINNDPLFRKGEYGKLTYAMLYHYTDDYLLELSHDEFTEDKNSFYDMVSGEDLSAKLADIRSSYGFMFTHPGKKLLCMGQDIGLPYKWSVKKGIDRELMSKEEYKQMMVYLHDLNSLYKNYPALYEQDDLSDGFEWLDSVSAEETVLAYVRRDDAGNELTVAVNFTPVDRPDFQLGVAKPGKYTEIFNSDNEKYGGKGKVKTKVNFSDDVEKYGREDSISVMLPASSIVIYEYEPYTPIEMKEIEIKKKARIAKQKADREALIAEKLKEEAEIEAKKALEAEKIAKAAAEAALKAQALAEKKAAEAVKASEKIEAEMRRKLETLHKQSTDVYNEVNRKKTVGKNVAKEKKVVHRTTKK